MVASAAFDPSALFSGAAVPAFPVPAGKLAGIQQTFATEWAALTTAARSGQLAPLKDRRFSGEAWQSNSQALLMAHTYLLSSRMLSQMADALEATPAVRERVRFAVMQWVEAMAPSNFLALNPDAQRKIVESSGEALRLGLANLVADVQKGRITQTDETQFSVGTNVATTPGSVVFENRLMQVIQYAPSTPTVHARPLLIVPPCINKFYILDLQPHNSLVRYAVEQGFTVFLVSWRNPLVSDTDGIDQATWDDYVQEGVLAALAVVQQVSRQPQVNALGFCVGGTLLATALAVAQARGERPVAALTLLTTLLDFSDTGVLSVFVDENHVQVRERQMGQGGLMPARDLASTFAFLRPSELVWNYVVGNYLKGERPPAFDLLYWNADSTNLPGPFFAWYLRNTYLENNLSRPRGVTTCGVPVDLSTLDMPAYVFGSREDHIVPWRTAYASTGLLRGPRRFVLGASGHIAGVVNPASRNKRSYWVVEGAADDVAPPADPTQWLEAATEQPGSWWSDWAEWLKGHSGARRRPAKTLGDANHPPLEDAPGRYVRTRAV